MADYYPLLARAVAALPVSTPDARRSIYERARKALLGQLRRVDPPVPEEDIQRENDALDVAIARLEREVEAAARAAGSAEAPPAAAPPPAQSPPPPPPRANTPTPAPAQPKTPDGAVSKPTTATVRVGAGTFTSRIAQPAPPPSAPPPAAPSAPQAGSAAPPSAAPTAPPSTPAVAPKGVVPPRVEPTIPAPERPVARPGISPGIARDRIWPPPSRSGAATSEPSSAPLIVSPRQAPTTASTPDVPPVVAKPPEAPAAPARPVLPIVEPDAKRPAEPVSEVPPIAAPPEEGDERETSAKSAGPLSKLRIFGRARDKEKSGAFDAALDAASFDEPVAVPLPEPVQAEPMRPIAPQPRVQRASNLRYWLFAAILLLVVGGIATLAFRLRDNPEDFARVTRPNPAGDSAESQSGKIVERIGAGPSASSQRATTPSAPASSQPNAPRTPSQQQPATAPASQAPIIPVAHRAALLIEAPDDPQRVRTFVGTVLWRIDRVAGAPPALVADIDLPDARFKATFRISKNTDPRLPASHTIDLRFTTAPDGEIPDVKEIDTLQMRAEDRPAGEPLSGIPAAITTNYFLIGLSGSDSAQSRNIELMRNRAWFDLPMLLVNGKIAKITFEKGATGERMLNDVLAAWKSS